MRKAKKVIGWISTKEVKSKPTAAIGRKDKCKPTVAYGGKAVRVKGQ